MAVRRPTRTGVPALTALTALCALPGTARSAPAADPPPPELISRTPQGAVPDADSRVGPMSADGRIVTYTSRATDIATVLTGLGDDRAFVVDRDTGVTHLLATRPDGSPRSGASRPMTVSTGGRYVYYAYAYWGTAPDPHEARSGETLRYDTRTGAVVSVSDLALTPSGNGRAGVLVTEDRLTPDDTNDGYDAYRVDLTRGHADQPVELLSRRPDGSASGQAVPLGLAAASLSDDGRRVVFADDRSGRRRIYLWDAATGATRPLPGDSTGDVPVISGDGGVVAYETGGQVVWRDLDRGSTHVLVPPAGWSPVTARGASLSRRGRYLSVVGAPEQDPTDLQVVRYDRATGASRTAAEVPAGAYLAATAISRDAGTIAFAFSPGGQPLAVHVADVE